MVVVGGGPAGAAVAIALARQGLPSVVMEASSGPEAKVGECLPPNASPLLKQLGLLERLRTHEHLPTYGNRFLWGTPIPVEQNFLFRTQTVGWHVHRRRFEALLYEVACEAGVDWHYGWQLRDCRWEAGSWLLTVQTAAGYRTLAADFVVDATGRSARFAQRAGGHRLCYDRMIGLATVLEPTRLGEIQDRFTLVEAVATGWWYSAALAGGQLAVVYFTDYDLLERGQRSFEGWWSLLQETEYTWERAQRHDYVGQGELRILPAGASRLTVIGGERWLAVGDAAMTYDPLSSYGMVSAMGGGFYAAQAVADALAGRSKALLTYHQMLERAYITYQVMHRRQYALEQRWPDACFWRRRHVA